MLPAIDSQIVEMYIELHEVTFKATKLFYHVSGNRQDLYDIVLTYTKINLPHFVVLSNNFDITKMRLQLNKTIDKYWCWTANGVRFSDTDDAFHFKLRFQ